MVYTLTFNPSLDYYVSVNDFEIGKTNRTCEETILPGGKGINVSTVLNNLDIDTVALGFIAGFTGDEIAKRVSEIGIKHDFIRLRDGLSRINVKLKNYDGTEINGTGPALSDKNLTEIVEKLSQCNANDYIVLSGSVPASLGNFVYKDICETFSKKGVNVVVDAEGEQLSNTVLCKPFLIKPNVHELMSLFNVKITSKDEAIPYMKILKEKGARNVLVSFGADGAVLIDENDEIHINDVPSGKLVNAVGAGDSMVAGFIAEYIRSADYERAFMYGICAGCATAYRDGLATKEDIVNLLK